MQALSGLQSTARCSELLAGKLWLAAPLKRNLTSGTVREAARQAKATLLRSTTVASAAQADRQATAAAPGFVDLAVDDRVLVSAPRLDHTIQFYQHSELNVCAQHLDIRMNAGTPR